ncbi:RidA family protein [Mycolicibacterium litorale]|uniref:RidA family protein n=1 Tax=Mycolicibacterium litorale TaxID=758802 RepID=UPI003CE9592F
MIEYINPEDDHYTPFGLSAGAATRDFVFAAGMALDVKTMGLMPGAETIAGETRICIEDIESSLAQVGCTLKDVVKTTCYLADDSYRQEFWAAYKEKFDGPPYPARTTLVVGIAGASRVEIDVVARRPQS